MPPELSIPSLDAIDAAYSQIVAPPQQDVTIPSLDSIDTAYMQMQANQRGRYQVPNTPENNIAPDAFGNQPAPYGNWASSGLKQGILGVVGGAAGLPRLVTGNENAPGAETANAAAGLSEDIDAARAQGGEGYMARQARGIVGSAGTAAIGALAGQVVKSPLVGQIGAAALQQANQSYNEARARGKTHEAANAYAREQGLLEGGVTAVFNMVGMGGAEKTLADAFKKDFVKSVTTATLKQGLKAVGKTGGKELLEEETTSWLQAIDAKLRDVQPDALTPESLFHLTLDTAVQTLGMTGMAFTPHATVAAWKAIEAKREKQQPVAPTGNAPQPPESGQPGQTSQTETAPQPAQQPVPQPVVVPEQRTESGQTPAPQVPNAPQIAPPETPAPQAPQAPAQEPATVRLYHGGSEYEGGSRWVTPDKVYAEGYAAKNGGQLYYVDVPADSPLLEKSFDDTGTGQKAPYMAFDAPESIAKNLRPVEAPTPLEVPAQPVHNRPPQIVEKGGEQGSLKTLADVQPETLPEEKPIQPDTIEADRKEADELGITKTITDLTIKGLRPEAIAERLMKAHPEVAKQYPGRTAHSNLWRLTLAVQASNPDTSGQAVGEWNRMVGPTWRTPRLAVEKSPMRSLAEAPAFNTHMIADMEKRKAEEAEKAKLHANSTVAPTVAPKTGPKSDQNRTTSTPSLPGAQPEMFGGSEAQGKLFNAAPAPKKPAQQAAPTKTESPADITIEQPTLPGQKELPIETKPLAQPQKERRAKAAKKAKQTRLSKDEELNVYRAAHEHGVPVEDLSDYIDAEIQAGDQHWQDLKEIVGKGLAPGQRKQLAEGDTESVRKLRLDEIREGLESETGVLRHTGIRFDEVQKALREGMPPRPTAADPKLVERAAKRLAEDLEKHADTSFDPKLFEDGAFMKVPKGEVPQVETEAAKVDLRKHMRDIEPAADRGTMVGTAELRKASGLSKEEFDKRAIEQARAGEISLYRHDYVAPLTPAEVADLIYAPHPESNGTGDHPKGTYFNGLSIRRQEPGAFYKGKTPPVVPTAAAGTTKGPISALDIQRTVDHDFGMPTLKGRVPKGAQAFTSFVDGTVRISSQEWGNLAIVTHELAHHLDNTTDILKAPPLDVLMELQGLDYEPNRASPTEGWAEWLRHYLTADDAATLAPQTFEYLDDWLKAHPEIKTKIDKTRRLVNRFRLQNPQDAILSTYWNNGPASEVLEQPFAERFKERSDAIWEAMKNALRDETSIVKKIFGIADRKAGGTGERAEAFENLVDDLHRSDRRLAEAAWRNGIHTISGEHPKKLSEGAPEILKEIKKEEATEWENFVDAMDAISRIERMPSYNPGQPLAVYENLRDQIQADKDKFARFDKAARGMRQFAKGGLELLVHEGEISREAADRMYKSQEDYYMPRYRVQDYGLLGRLRTGIQSASRSLLPGGKVVHGMSRTGSPEKIMRPLDAYIHQNNIFHNRAVQKAILMPFLRMTLPSMGGAKDMGAFLTEVDAKSVKDRVKLGKLLDELTEEKRVGTEIRQPLLSKDDAQEIRDVTDLRHGTLTRGAWKRLEAKYGTTDRKALIGMTGHVFDMEDAINFWRRDFGASPKEHIVRVFHNEKPIMVQFQKAYVYNAITGMKNVRDAGTFAKVWTGMVRAIQTVFTAPQKAAAVALNVGTIVKLSTIDYPSFTLNSKKTGMLERYYGPFEGIGWILGSAMTRKWARNMPGVLAPVERFAKIGAILSDLQEEESGRVSSYQFGSQEKSIRALREATFARTQKEKLYTTLRYDTLNWFKDMNGMLDSGMRLAELNGAIRQKGYKPNPEARWDEIEAGKNRWIDKDGNLVDDLPRTVKSRGMAANNEVLTNFKKKGYATREADKVIMFASAAVAGSAKELSNMGEIVTGRGEAWGKRATAAAVLATAAAALWWARKDDDDQEGQDPDIANRYWTIGFGGIPASKIAKPRGYAIIPNLIEGLLDWMVKGKSPRLGQKAAAEFESLMPPMKPAGLGTMYELVTNQDWTGSIFKKGRPIDEAADEHLYTYLRSTPYTLETSKFLSRYFTQWLDLSPAKTEYFLQQYTGGQYGDLVGTVEKSVRGTLGVRDLPVVNKFATHGLYQQSLRDFYDRYNGLQKTVESARRYPDEILPDPDKTAQLSQLTRYKKALTDIRNVAVDLKDTEAKLDLDRYRVGLADYATGQKARKSYPNPLAKSEAKVPEVVKQVREDYVASMAHIMTTTPKRRIGEPFDKFRDRFQLDARDTKFAADEMHRLGYKAFDIQAVVRKRARLKGHGVSDESLGEIMRAMAAK